MSTKKLCTFRLEKDLLAYLKENYPTMTEGIEECVQTVREGRV